MLSEPCLVNPSECASLRVVKNRWPLHSYALNPCRIYSKQVCKVSTIGKAIEERNACILRARCYALDSDDDQNLQHHRGFGKKHTWREEPPGAAVSRVYQSCLEEASKQEGKFFRPTRSRSIVAEARPPLTREEEQDAFADVQDLLHLDNIKEGLQKKLGRLPTDREWADSMGCSICRLYARIGKGRAAKRKMIAANLPLVDSIAKQFGGRGLSHQELCQEGVLGLLKSTEKFDISHNAKFSTYSFFWIRERMLAAARKFQHIWMVGKSVSKIVSNVLQCKDEFRVVHGRNPSMDELVLVSRIEADKIRQAFWAIRPTKMLGSRQASFDQEHERNALYAEPEDPEGDVLPWLALLESDLRAELGMLFLMLSPRELQVLNMRYGLCGDTPLTLTEIAALFGVSHEAVRMAEKNALLKLRRVAEKHDLQQYL